MCKKEELNIEFTEDDFYKTLKLNDKEIISHFYDPSVNDKDYFKYGIYSDILSNALSLQINKMSNNLDSLGVDNNCRAIIEGLTILKMDKDEVISDEQKHLYRYQYALVDFGNFDNLLSEADKEHENYKQLWKDKEKAIEAATKCFNCTRDEIIKSAKRTKYDNPDFYLKKRLKDRVSFAKLIKEYPIFGEDSVKIYQLFSIFAHPRFELKRDFEKTIYEVRAKYIDLVFAAVSNFIVETNLPIAVDHKDKKIPGINEDLWENPVLSSNVHNVRLFESTIANLQQKLCIFDRGWDAFSYYYLDKCRYLIIDMMITLSLGYKEQAISKFKSFMEYTSVFIVINCEKSQREFTYLKKAFCLSSRLQFEELFSSMGIKNIQTIDKDDLKDFYDNYYKNKYNLNSLEDFEKNIRSNSLYFLTGEGKSYDKIVQRALQELFSDERKRDFAYGIFKLANDMNHSSGYNFNASMGIWDMNQAVLTIAFRCLITFSFLQETALRSNGFEVSVSTEINQLILFLKASQEELNNVIETYAKA